MRSREGSISGLRTDGLRSPFASLLSMQFRVEYGARGLSDKLGLGKRSRNAWLYLVLIGLAFFPMIGMLYRMGDNIAAQSIAMNQPGLGAVMAVMMGQFLVFFVGVSALMSTLYYATDIEVLQALPLTGSQVLGAKVLVAYVAQLGFSAILSLPFLIPLGLRLGSPAFWPVLVLTELAIPAMPLSLALLTIILIMRGTKGTRHKDTLRVILGLAFFVLVIAFQYLNTSMIAKGPQEVMDALMRPNGLVQMMSAYYPPLRWAALALTGWQTGGGFMGTVGFAGGSLAVLFAVLTVTQGWFLGGLGSEVATRGKRRETTGLRGGDVTGSARKGGLAKAAVEGAKAAGTIGVSGGLFSRERRPSTAVSLRDHWVLTRTPNFLLVVLTNMALVPIMLAFSAVGGGELKALLGSVAGVSSVTITLIGAAVQGILASMNQVASTSISREGATFWLSKMIPVPARVQVRGKLHYSLVICAIQLVTLLASLAIVLRLDAYHLAVTAALGMLASWPVSALCVINDLHSPRLNWSEPHQAMKGNFATLGAMLLSVVYLWLCVMAVGAGRKAGLGEVPLYLLAAAILIGSGILLQRYMENLSERKYASTEV